MDEIKRLESSSKHILPIPESGAAHFDSKVRIVDERVARLLLVLRELDQSVAGLEALPPDELSELVGNAIASCGFTDQTEARYAITAVLEAIENRDPMLQSS
jgi:hypothetical protein